MHASRASAKVRWLDRDENKFSVDLTNNEISNETMWQSYMLFIIEFGPLETLIKLNCTYANSM